jgi:pimeloyl-[acyl-carrier protein] methyl ester esterase
MSRLHVDVQGSGPPLVLLHGWAMHGGVFEPLAQRMRARYTLHLVDLPGHGFSRDSEVALELEATVDAIVAQVPDAPWCAWSLGGLFALHAALRSPARLPALVMLCASPRFVRGEDWRYGVSPEIFQDFAHGLRSDYRGTLDRFVALEAFGADHAREAVRALRQQLFARGEPPAQVLARGLELLETVDLREGLAQLGVPSLWIAGRRDRLVDPRAMREAATRAPDAQFVQIEHGGHAPFLTHAGEVAGAIEAFLATDAGSRAQPPSAPSPASGAEGVER